MLSYVGKLFHTILPSVLATVLGAYLVNYYILPKPPVDKPPAAASAAETPKPEPASLPVKAAEPVVAPKPVEPRPRASEKPVDDKRRPEKAAAKPDKPDEATETRKSPARDAKAAARPAAASTVAAPPPAVVAPAAASTPTGEPETTLDERRDANDLARAAIERLRSGSKDAAPENETIADKPVHEVAVPPVHAPPVHAPPVVRVQPLVASPAAPSIEPLPPAISVEGAPELRRETPHGGSGDSVVRNQPGHAPRPPGSIPEGAPIELHGEARPQNVAEDVLSAAKSMFQSVIPAR